MAGRPFCLPFAPALPRPPLPMTDLESADRRGGRFPEGTCGLAACPLETPSVCCGTRWLGRPAGRFARALWTPYWTASDRGVKLPAEMRASRISRRGLRALFVVALAASGSARAAPAVDPAATVAATRLQARFGDAVEVSWQRATRVARFVRLSAGSAGDLSPAAPGASLDARVQRFLRQFGDLFGIHDPATELGLVSETTDRLGFRHLVYRQIERGVPVFAAVLHAHFDRSGRLRSVQGTFVPGIDLDPRPRIGPEAAMERARVWTADRFARPVVSLAAGDPSLVFHRPGLERGLPGSAFLAWTTVVGDGGRVRERIFVDATRDKVRDGLPLVYDERLRRTYTGLDQAPLDGVPDSWPDAPDWVEGDPFPTGSPERDGALAATADVYAFYAALGLDSYDGEGHLLDMAWNQAAYCPNASWNGRLTSFCAGFAVHDVVAHEWSHAYTEATDGLFYRWQSGALNESFSDIWGESLDLSNRLVGVHDTDDPDLPRPPGACSGFAPERLVISQPLDLELGVGMAAFGPPATAGPPLRLEPVRDGVGADPYDGCQPYAIPGLAGNLAFANRGECDFQTQARNAQAAGAVGLVIGNRADSPDPDRAPAMECDFVTACDLSIAIPVVSLDRADADLVRGLLSGGAEAAILPGENAGALDSVRWLLGEDVRPLGVARDMWNPDCLGAPGKVSDAEYFCGTADNGGVHVNSGVPNHAFALLVDGGTFNGRTFPGIGLARAALIYWRAESVYQVPTTDFADHADALAAACDDLTGTPLPDPFGGPDVTVGAGDCAALGQVLDAVEMRATPGCGFQPVLAPDPPPVCGKLHPYALSTSTFDDGADGWSVSRRAVASPATFDDRDWTRVASLPDGRPGTAFFAPDPVVGDCVTGEAGDDDSGVLVLESPDLWLPTGRPARLAFDHYVATEKDWDGGNVKLSVAGGPWTVVPASAFLFNGYPSALLDPPQNTDPLAGEPAFHGTDEGSNSGSWGRSIVDLTGLVEPGSRFRIRFELGSDLCFGSTLGWWVDDVTVSVCADGDPIFLDGFEIGNPKRWSAFTL